MDFYEVIKTRRSVRNYKPDPVPEDALKRIAEAVSLAPHPLAISSHGASEL